jgi:chaperonin GroES
MKVKPIGERILVKREEVEEKSSGGIILTQTQQEVPAQGEVRAVGDVEGIEVGDTVVFGKYAGSDALDVDGETLHFIDLKDIKAVIYG